MEIIKIRLTDLEQNKGQVEGLPSNPRQWGRGELDHLIKSIQETPELLEARGLIVWPYGGKYVILGGNMRFSALREMNAKDAPCYVLPKDTPMEKLREIVIKDNGAFGRWDYDMLANEWDDLPLADWGVPAWDPAPVDESAVDALFEVQTFYESQYLAQGFPITYLAFAADHEGAFVSPEWDEDRWKDEGHHFVIPSGLPVASKFYPEV